MAGLFTTDENLFLNHGFEDIGVADWSDFSFDFVFLTPFEKALVGHDCGGDFWKTEIVRDCGDNFVAVNYGAVAVDEEAAVAVAIEGCTEVELVGFNKIDKSIKMSAATIIVNAGAVVGIGVNCGNFCAEGFEDLLGSNRSCTVGTIESDFVAS